MPQVVALLNEEEHKALARRAKLNRRSIGNQLIAEAFLNEGREVPEYLNKRQSDEIRALITEAEGQA